MRGRSLAVIGMLLMSFSAQAADKVKIGFISTLSGPLSGLGVEIQDGFNLALKEAGNKLGGLLIEVVTGDDQANAGVGKQLADKFIKLDHVDFLTGIVYSNVMMAVAPTTAAAKTFYISAAAGPAALAGAKCSPYFFAAGWQNDGQSEAMGQYLTDKGLKNIFVIAPNYAGGKENVEGFKRTFKGRVVAEVYPKLGELDFASEVAQIRAAKPDAVFFFLPGGMGVNFVKQYVSSGLDKDIPFYTPGYSADEDTIRAVGAPLIGLQNSSQWSWDLDNAANKQFVSHFTETYKHLPSMYAALGYDTVRLLDRAVADVKGNLKDAKAVHDAIAAARFSSVRGDFKFNTNQFPITSFYLRQIEKGSNGQIANKTISKIFDNHKDSYAGQCDMKPL